MWRLLVILLIMNKDKQCIRLFFMAEYMSGTQISEGTSKVASVNGIIVSSVEIDHVCVCVCLSIEFAYNWVRTSTTICIY
jgi:hypothetical protein